MGGGPSPPTSRRRPLGPRLTRSHGTSPQLPFEMSPRRPAVRRLVHVMLAAGSYDPDAPATGLTRTYRSAVLNFTLSSLAVHFGRIEDTAKGNRPVTIVLDVGP